MDRTGYLQWRTKLKIYHADLLSEILEENRYSPEEIKKVRQLVMKNKLKTDEETQTLEDVICLVFLRYYFEEFITKHSKEKVVAIVRKTWLKMSQNAHEFALKLSYPQHINDILVEALEK